MKNYIKVTIMNKNQQLTFYKSEYMQYHTIMEDPSIKEQVSSFLTEFISLEAFYKKMLRTLRESEGKKLSTQDKKNLRMTMTDVKRVMEFFDISYDEALMDRVFGSKDNSYMDCSIKKLRDRLVHNVNSSVIRVILERYDSLQEDLRAVALLLQK